MDLPIVKELRNGCGSSRKATETMTRAADLIEKLAEALEKARRYVKSQNDAEGMLNGLGPRKPRRSDADLAVVDAALALAKGE